MPMKILWAAITGIAITDWITVIITIAGVATGMDGIAVQVFIGPAGGVIIGGGMIRLITVGAIGMTAGGGGRIQIT